MHKPHDILQTVTYIKKKKGVSSLRFCRPQQSGANKAGQNSRNSKKNTKKKIAGATQMSSYLMILFLKVHNSD